MDIVEEVVRQRRTFALEEPERAYSELRDLLERRMSFDHVSEEQYFNDVDEGTIRSKIAAVEWYDNVTKEKIEIYLYISKPSRELDIQVKGKLVTTYEVETGWKNNLFYYAYRSLYDKFLYGQVRHGYEPAVEEKVSEMLHRVRENVEAHHG